MSRQLIGQVLCHMGKLTPMDIDEILEEQALSGRRFGEIAVAWGLCDVEHIGEAWFRQLVEQGPDLDLSEIDIDTYAAHCLSPTIARRLGALPIRIMGDIMVVAASGPMDNAQLAELSHLLPRDLRFVTVDPLQVQQAIEICVAAAA